MFFYNDIDTNCCKILQQLVDKGALPSGTINSESITQIQSVESFPHQCHFFAGIGGWPIALKLAGIPESANVWTGSCPCQPFSVAGKKRATGDSRHLWPEFYRLIQKHRPTIIFGEQVASPLAYAWWDTVAADLEDALYSCAAASLCAYAVQLPHQRQRLFWVAYTDKNGLPDWIPAWEQRVLAIERKEPFIASQTSGADIGFETLWDLSGATLLTKPGVCPVVDGIPSRMGRKMIASYGNAIVPLLAAEFVISALLSLK